MTDGQRILKFLALWSCGYSPVKIYQHEVVQGNFVSKEQVQALRAGMPRQAVREILGTPLVTSVFHAERWDYAFTIRRQGSEPQLRRFTVYFKGDVLDRVGDARHLLQDQGRQLFDLVGLRDLEPQHWRGMAHHQVWRCRRIPLRRR